MSLANCEECIEETVRMNVLLTSGEIKERGVEKCVIHLVKALNDAGIPTAASCCGHKRGFGNVVIDPRRVSITFGVDGLPLITLLTVDRKKTMAEAMK